MIPKSGNRFSEKIMLKQGASRSIVACARASLRAIIAARPNERRRRMDAVTPKSKQQSHVVRPAAMEWQTTRFPGCEIKTLLFDTASGLVTVLTRFAPGAVLPDHE